MSDTVPIKIRLAIRAEGEFVNAYVAQSDSMDLALLMGSIRRTVLERDSALWERWKQVMSDALSNTVEDIFEERPTMTETLAPQHERSGRA